MQASSSTQKGESLQDTMRMFSSYADVVVMRHPTRVRRSDRGTSARCTQTPPRQKKPLRADVRLQRFAALQGSCRLVAEGNCGFGKATKKSVLVSGGDGNGEHPTQALLDLFTIAEHSAQWMAHAVSALASGESQAVQAKATTNLSPPAVAFAGDLLNGR